MNRPVVCIVVFLFISLIVLSGELYAENKRDREVVIYTGVDQIFSEPILKDFEKRYNITVKAVYDIEAVKTTGLVNRLIAEKNNPRCDVFWNNEIVRSILLKRKGVLASYFSPSAVTIPDRYKDNEGFWAGFGARARVLVVNSQLLKEEEYPTSFNDIADLKWKGKVAMANPLFGTTATHVAVMYTILGPRKIKDLYKQMVSNHIRIVDGNSVVRDMVARGEVLWGLTDTDDVNVGILSGMPIKVVLPDQDGDGALLIPNTVSLIANAPHPLEAKLLIDFLLSEETERVLCQSASVQIPLRGNIPVPKGQCTLDDVISLKVDYEEIANAMTDSTKIVQNIFLK